MNTVEDFIIAGNSALTSIAGFDNLTAIKQSILIYLNNELSSIDGFDNVNYIGAKFSINDNPKLATIGGFSQISSVEGDLEIYNNNVLTNLSALESLASVNSLKVYDNNQLNDCKSLCFLLNNEGAIRSEILLQNNLHECNSKEEIIKSCEESLSTDNYEESLFEIYPNPSSNSITIRTTESIKSMIVYNTLGKMILEQSSSTINISNLPKGIYIAKIVFDNNEEIVQRIVKQ